jgi:hypothetical protein
VCGELIFLLTRLKLEPAAALHYWPTVLAQRAKLARLWGQPVDLRVGLMSYFLDVERRLDRPTVVEMDWTSTRRHPPTSTSSRASPIMVSYGASSPGTIHSSPCSRENP